MKDWNNYLRDFESISLSQLDDINFSDRQDTKSIFPAEMLPRLIDMLKTRYHILEVNGTRIFNYESIYLDTPDFKFYNDHQRNKARRHKIRFRRYVDEGSSFFEIKTKNGKGRSSKKRIPTNGEYNRLTSPLKEVIRQHAQTDPEILLPSLQVTVNRITLLSNDRAEKITLDVNVQFSLHGKVKEMNDLVIAEVKQIRFNSGSDFFKIQRQFGIHPISISKYCVGVASLNEEVKTNRFRPSLRKIHQIIN